MANPTLEDLLDKRLLQDLNSLSLEQLRLRRQDSQHAEAALSYVRRVVQGRLDIVAAALSARSSGNSSDVSALVENLPQILADSTRRFQPAMRPEGLTQFESDSEPYAKDLTDELDQLLPANPAEWVARASADELRTTLEQVTNLEMRVSGMRKDIHELIDALQRELVRRYKSGEASVETLLEEHRA